MNISYANDIREFQLVEISIGDSLLDYYNIAQINEARETNFKDKLQKKTLTSGCAQGTAFVT